MESVKQHNEVIKDSSQFNRQISIWLDKYDDIFSDFDPRPFSERILSDDFITELKKVSREEEFEVSELRLLVPEKVRNIEVEHIIVKRLHTYLRKGNYYISRRVKTSQGRGILFALAGMVMILLASYVAGIESGKFITKVLLVMLEPAGWFFVWTGMDTLFFSSRQRKAELKFYIKMAKARIVFNSIT